MIAITALLLSAPMKVILSFLFFSLINSTVLICGPKNSALRNSDLIKADATHLFSELFEKSFIKSSTSIPLLSKVLVEELGVKLYLKPSSIKFISGVVNYVFVIFMMRSNNV